MKFLVLLCLSGVFALGPPHYHHKEAGDSVNFLAIGDWGGVGSSPYTTSAEVKNAGTMGKMAESINSRFTLALGDNFYSLGIRGDAHNFRFKDTFEDVFTASSLQKTWYVLAGNHDHYGNVSAEIAYTKLSNRWKFPDYYYTFTETLTTPQGKDVTMEVVMIDTVLLAGESYHNEKTDVFVEPKGPANVYLAEDQWKYIEQKLSSSKADYLFAAGHYPIWSICSHGPTRVLVDRLNPMLKKYKATGYFSGHDHCQEYLEHDELSYILTGAGHDCCYDPSHKHAVPSGALKFSVDKSNHGSQIGGFATVSFNATAMVATYWDSMGNRQYSTPPIRPRTHAEKHHHERHHHH
eukprot:TRINITY_DN68120_c1_g2_i1.p1 TRINITY_DN68120_c1_g2~~TRINITY_DN68120_c1_g2_i1.p1  ORF type:complete len:350 (+),score=47.27 TRINITY_DN68120_c1_g2_i1:25-1074(+)